MLCVSIVAGTAMTSVHRLDGVTGRGCVLDTPDRPLTRSGRHDTGGWGVRPAGRSASATRCYRRPSAVPASRRGRVATRRWSSPEPIRPPGSGAAGWVIGLCRGRAPLGGPGVPETGRRPRALRCAGRCDRRASIHRVLVSSLAEPGAPRRTQNRARHRQFSQAWDVALVLFAVGAVKSTPQPMRPGGSLA